MKYEKRKMFIYNVGMNFLIVLLCFMVFILGKIVKNDTSLIIQFIIGGGMGIVAVVILMFRDLLFKKLNNHEKGLNGEVYFKEMIEKELKQGEYRLIPDLKSKKNGDIDFVLICDHGVYCIEVKNVRGIVKYNRESDKLFVDKYQKKYLSQVRGNAKEIKEILKNSGEEIKFVTPVLIMSDRALVDIKEDDVRYKTKIFYSNSFIKYLKAKKVLQNKIDVEKIYKILNKS